MKKIGFLTLLFAAIISLIACESGPEAPEGMQLVRGGEEYGYYFYAPEEWTVANNGEISAAYASKVDVSSVTLAPAAAPLADIESYFENALSEFTYTITNTPTIEACDFGNATSAYKAIYDFEYNEHSFRSMQIFASYGESFYIFTFTAQLVDRTEDETYYDFYLEKIQSVIDNIEFVEKTATIEAPEYSKDSDGYLLVSDDRICGYDLYIHPDWTVRYAQSNISISTAGGVSANITEATSVGVSYKEYWQTRKTELSAIVDELTVIGSDEGVATSLGNSTWAFAFEYTYKYNGELYHVYQVIAVAGQWPIQDGYVFTYTSPEAEYQNHLDEALKMMKKVNFR